jgi:dephospho-CoA kinase
LSPHAHPHSIPVVGIAGGIGSGKSAVARILSELGAVVIDSDTQAKAALEQPEVRAELARWWGPGVLHPDGSVDRKRIADIVFHHERERQRLEALIHPLVRQSRAALIRQARAAGAPLAVIDAPLLFEAAVDAECDAVIFVDTPRDLRLDRLAASRGWDDAELSRRERSQLPLQEKRRRSTHTVTNFGDPAALRAQVEAVYRQLLRTS